MRSCVRGVVWSLVTLLAVSPLTAQEPPAGAQAEATARAEEILRLREELARLAERQEELAARLAELAERDAGGETERGALAAEIAELREELARIAEEARQATASLEAVSEAERRRINLNVYGDFQASAFRGEDSLFDGRAFELVLSGQPHARLSFFSEIEFERAAAVGEERGGEVLVEQAYATFHVSPLLNLRAGILLVPFGNVNVDHFAPRRDVVSKPIVSWVVAPSDWTDNGLGLQGSRLLGTAWLLSYEAYAIAGLDSEVNGFGLRDARQGYGVDNNADKALVGRAALSRLGSVTVGLSGYRGRYDDDGRRALAGWAIDGLFEHGRLRLTGEYDSLTADGAPDARFRGFYARLSFDVLKDALRPTPLGRDFSDPRLTAVYQYDRVKAEGPVGDAFEETTETRHTLGLNFRPSDNWVLKLNYEINRTDNLVLYQGNREGFIGAIGFVF